MPYSGGTTLADLLRSTQTPLTGKAAPLTGKALINTLDARASRTWRKRASHAVGADATDMPTSTSSDPNAQQTAERNKVGKGSA